MRFRLPAFGPAQMVLTLAILLLGLFAYAFLQTAAQAYRLRETERTMFDEVHGLREQRAELEGLAAYLESDEYVEAFARQQFGLVKPGETLVVVDAPTTSGPVRRPGERWWEALFDTAAPLTPTPGASPEDLKDAPLTLPADASGPPADGTAGDP
ncbi:MAG: septum formation initiator family protein [Dehalococcoidia bacterium]|nr:septum formation initiator family protein [Dehalococcoidia bacterium]MCA9856834.1 septum formation initiator family protein [Dehalococcoidia bacterium]MCB9492096.1 septum formation initiator family protein [Dehalococcoidia bacterium]